MIYANTVAAIEQARTRFTKRWQTALPGGRREPDGSRGRAVHVPSFPELAVEGLRTTNALERINEEFRHRTKTQASSPGQDAVLLLLFGLLRSGQVKLRALVGYQDMEAAKAAWSARRMLTR